MEKVSNYQISPDPLSANPKKRSNTLKQFVSLKSNSQTRSILFVKYGNHSFCGCRKLTFLQMLYTFRQPLIPPLQSVISPNLQNQIKQSAFNQNSRKSVDEKEKNTKDINCKVCCFSSKHINPFSPNIKNLYPLKTSKNQRSSDLFRGYRNAILDQNGFPK